MDKVLAVAQDKIRNRVCAYYRPHTCPSKPRCMVSVPGGNLQPAGR